MRKLVAIITARGGSKGLPGKNIIDLNGKPLIAHTIDSAKESGIFSDIVVTTDDTKIKDISSMYGAVVIDRPKSLATDKSTSLDVIEHALMTLKKKGRQYHSFVLLQPTSPLRNARHIKEAFNLYTSQNASSLVSITEQDHSPYKCFIEEDESFKPLFGWQYLTMPRQELPKVHRTNGAIYICRTDAFLRAKNIFEKPLKTYNMDPYSSVDIDTAYDLELAKILLKRESNNEQH